MIRWTQSDGTQVSYSTKQEWESLFVKKNGCCRLSSAKRVSLNEVHVSCPAHGMKIVKRPAPISSIHATIVAAASRRRR